LGDIVHLDVNKVGFAISVGQPIASIESVKSTSDIYSPVSGEIKEVLILHLLSKLMIIGQSRSYQGLR